MAKLWLLDFVKETRPAEESKSISRAPGYYQWVLVVIIIIFIIIILFIYLSIFIANKFLLTTVNKNFS